VGIGLFERAEGVEYLGLSVLMVWALRILG
jgi:hypothetical protein